MKYYVIENELPFWDRFIDIILKNGSYLHRMYLILHSRTSSVKFQCVEISLVHLYIQKDLWICFQWKTCNSSDTFLELNFISKHFLCIYPYFFKNILRSSDTWCKQDYFFPRVTHCIKCQIVAILYDLLLHFQFYMKCFFEILLKEPFL